MKKVIIICISVISIIIICFVIKENYFKKKKVNDYLMGGAELVFHNTHKKIQESKGQIEEDYNEQYHRPSKQLALSNPYNFQYVTNNKNNINFKKPEEVIYAYYGVLEEAANMEGYSGGCGSIGEGKTPYPYAYQLLSKEKQSKISLEEFEKSFEGIGHITFLKIQPAYKPQGTPKNTQYYMIEIEAITGKKEEPTSYDQTISYFEYYYGIITVKKENNNWKIQDMLYQPEEFLCAPYHSWFYDAQAVVSIIYIDNLKLVDKITNIEYSGDNITIYATGKGEQYRFDFIRLTNGHDILLHENILENGKWKETNLLSGDWSNTKFSILTFTNSKK